MLIAFQGGTQKWVYVQPCSSIVDVQVGTNGNIYMLVRDGNGCSGYPKLVGVEPELANGQSSPTVVANTQIQRNLPSNGGLSPYSGGLVVRFTDGVGFYDYSGVRDTNAPGWNLDAGFYDGQAFATADTGRAFVPIKAAPSPLCNNDPTVMESITAMQPSGVNWSAALPACSRVGMIRPLYTGGLVALVSIPVNPPSNVYVTKLYAIGPNGAASWEQNPADLLYNPGNYTYEDMAYTTDLNGNVVLLATYRKRENGLDYGGIKLVLIGGFTGAYLSSFEMSGGTSDGYGFRLPGGLPVQPPIGKDAVFLPLTQCNGYGNCDYSTTKLYSVKVPGLTMDYPRGAILQDGLAWKNYVAMGDSYSSSEGVPSFMPPSDTNDCHRSYGAYAMGINGAPGTRLKLQPYQSPGTGKPTTTFVACSGAETTHVNGGKGGEPPQLNALSTGTDIVTLTIGGNDIKFVQYATACVDPNTSCDGQMHGDTVLKIQDELPGKLDSLFGNIENRISLQTRVLVIGYPLIMPEPATPTTWPSCTYMSTNEKTAARDVIERLNKALHDAVSRAGAGFEYVEPNYAQSPFRGRELCNDGSFFNGVTGPPNVAYSFHPNAGGQEAYRKVVETYLAG